jgi:hypothetical protein
MTDWQNVEDIANAILYEGYSLYPYRPSADKNQQRWTFGRIMPQKYANATGNSDPWRRQSECLLQSLSPEITLRLRFLHISEPLDHSGVGWQQAVERDLTFSISGLQWTQDIEYKQETLEAGTTAPMQARVHAMVSRVNSDSDAALWQVQVRVDNMTEVDANVSEMKALRHSMIAAHWVLHDAHGCWISATDPPEDLAPRTSALEQQGVWPVLAGDAQDSKILLASPIILYDYPAIAEQSAGNLFDGAEIDEILTLRILTMTDDEKNEAMDADPRLRQMLERTKNVSRDALYNLHGLTYQLPQKRGGQS